MSDRDAFKERERGFEEEYFLRKERELVEKMRRRVELEKQRQEIAKEIGISNEEIIKGLQDLGYSSETVKLIHLMPLVQVAWADGHVDDKEKNMIIELARSSQIAEGSEADLKLARWLNERPSDEVMQAHLLAVQAVIKAFPDEFRASMRENLINYSVTLAAASRGLFGLAPKISKSERAVIEQIIEAVAPEDREAVKKLLGR